MKKLKKLAAVATCLACTFTSIFAVTSFADSFSTTGMPYGSGSEITAGGYGFNPKETLYIDLENTVDYVDVEGQKYWVGDTGLEENRPEQITVHLYADGEDTGSSTTTSRTEDWKYSFTNLNRYKDGEEIVYSVVEDVPDEYTVSYGDLQIQENEDENSIITLDITNTFSPTIGIDVHTPQVEEIKDSVNVSGTKTWNDNNDEQGMRPEQVTVHLYADGVDTGYSVTLSEADGWCYSFKNFPKYDYEGDGHEIEYTVVEDVPEGYSVKYSNTTQFYKAKMIFRTYKLTPEQNEKFTSFGYHLTRTSKNSETEDGIHKSFNVGNSSTKDYIEGAIIFDSSKDLLKYDSKGSKYDYDLVPDEDSNFDFEITKDEENRFTITVTAKEYDVNIDTSNPNQNSASAE